jgi:hypothetical protein
MARQIIIYWRRYRECGPRLFNRTKIPRVAADLTRYLLGSGGTLLFDLTIMLQSLMYGSAPPVHPPPYERSSTFGRRPMFRRRTTRFLEDGHAGSGHVSRSPHAQPQHLSGERQPLMSGSVNLGESPTTTVRERERSLSPEAVRGRQT